MNKRIPIKAAKDFAKQFGLAQVIIVAWEVDEKARCAQTHVVTYGKTKEDCVQAAEGGNKVKKALGWPDSLNAMPARMKGKVIFDAKEMKALRHLLLHFRHDYTGDEKAELAFSGLDDSEIEKFLKKTASKHAEET